MKRERDKELEYVLVKFGGEDAWAEWELRFNIGSKKLKPVKFAAYQRWASSSVPGMFGGIRASFKSKLEASTIFAQHVAEYGGAVQKPNKAQLERAREKYGKALT